MKIAHSNFFRDSYIFENPAEYHRKCSKKSKSQKPSAVDSVVTVAVFVVKPSFHLNRRLIFSKISHLWQEDLLIILEVLPISRNLRLFWDNAWRESLRNNSSKLLMINLSSINLRLKCPLEHLYPSRLNSIYPYKFSTILQSETSSTVLISSMLLLRWIAATPTQGYLNSYLLATASSLHLTSRNSRKLPKDGIPLLPSPSLFWIWSHTCMLPWRILMFAIRCQLWIRLIAWIVIPSIGFFNEMIIIHQNIPILFYR